MAMKRKAPNKYSRFSWARIPTEGGITYRLFRRDFNGVLHCEFWTFDVSENRDVTATRLCAMRKVLLERVDAIELTLLELS